MTTEQAYRDAVEWFEKVSRHLEYKSISGNPAETFMHLAVIRAALSPSPVDAQAVTAEILLTLPMPVDLPVRARIMKIIERNMIRGRECIGWTPEGLRKMAENPIDYSDELSSLAFYLADAIEGTFTSKRFTNVFAETSEKDTP